MTLRDIPGQVQAQIVSDPLASPLLRPFAQFPATIAAADQERLRRAAAETYARDVRPAYERLLAFVSDSYLPGARDPSGWARCPTGKAWYAFRARSFTTTALTPQQIHELGLAEVKRIRGQMDSVIASRRLHRAASPTSSTSFAPTRSSSMPTRRRSSNPPASS